MGELISKDSDFLCIKATPQIRSKAIQRAESLGVLKNSITKGEGNYAGYLGEEAVKIYLCGLYTEGDSVYNHDLIVGETRIEVKTKRRTVPPRLSYEVSIAKTSGFQQPDYYVFTSVNNDNIWILGYISRDEYFSKARFVPAGTLDPSNRFVCHRNMYNLSHQELYPIREMRNVLSFKY